MGSSYSSHSIITTSDNLFYPIHQINTQKSITMAPKILVVLTSADKMTTTGKPTGWYLPELAHPYNVLASKAELVMASPKGGKAPLDQASVEAFKEDKESVDFLNNKSSVWETPPLSRSSSAAPTSLTPS